MFMYEILFKGNVLKINNTDTYHFDKTDRRGGSQSFNSCNEVLLYIV